MGKIIYYREETTQGVAFLKSEIRCSISSKKVHCITKEEKRPRPTLGYYLRKIWKFIKAALSFVGDLSSLDTVIRFIASLFC